MTVFKRTTGKVQDRGTRMEFDAKDVRGINGAEVYSRAPQYFDHFLGAETLSNTWTDTKVNTGTFAALASGLGGIGEIATSAASGDSNCEVLITNAALAGTSTSGLIPSKNALERPISFELRAMIPTLTTVEITMGLGATATQARTAIPNVVSAASATTTSACDDQAVFFFSSVPTTGALANSGFTNYIGTITSLATVDTVAAAKKIGGQGPGASTVAPVSGIANFVQADASFHIYRVEIDVNGNVVYLMDDVVVGTGVVTSTAAYVPFFSATTRAASARKLDVDYVQVAAGLAATVT